MIRQGKIYRLVYWIGSCAIAAVLLSGYHKLLSPADFAVSVFRFHLAPGFLINLAALYLPWLETVCAVCLLFIPRYRASALWIALFLLTGFTVAIGINLWRGSVFGCGCFGRGANDQPLSWMNMARNLGLMALVALALVARRKANSGGDEAPPSIPPA